MDEQTLANLVKGSSVVRSALVEVFVEELAKDAELRRAIVHRIAGEVATKRDLEELRKELEARIEGVRRDLETRTEGLRRDLEARIEGLRKDLEARIAAVEQSLRREVREVEARLHERIDRLQAQLNERIDRIHERIDTMIRWVIAFLVTTWAAIAALIVKLLL